MPSDHAFRYRIEVRFRDCDAMGHVNNAVYLTYLEQARFAFWRKLTGSTAGPEAGIIIARAEIDYRSAAYAGDLIEVRLAVGGTGRSSFTLTYEIVDESSGRRLVEARTVMVTYDYSARRPVPIPEKMRALLQHTHQRSQIDPGS